MKLFIVVLAGAVFIGGFAVGEVMHVSFSIFGAVIGGVGTAAVLLGFGAYFASKEKKSSPLNSEIRAVFDRMITGQANPTAEEIEEAKQNVRRGKTPTPTDRGATADTPIRIHAANSLEGIPKEYAILTTMFGTLNRDWKLIERSLIHSDDGRKLEKFIVSVSNKRREIYFDITDWFAGNTSQEAKATLANLISPHEKPVAILLPKNEFMTLEIGMTQLTEAQLNQIGLSLAERKSMIDPFFDTMKQWHGKEYASIPEHVSVTALMSVWSKIMGLLSSWQPADLLQEEELENLKAIIGGTMTTARNSPP
jgi:hypothetical protein